MTFGKNDSIVILILIACVCAIIPFIFILPGDIVYFTYALPAAAFLIIILLLDIKVMRFQAHPRWAIDHVLRAVDPNIYKITHEGRDIKFKVNSVVSLKFRAVYSRGATELIFKPDVTDEGLIAIIALYILTLSSFLIFPLAIFVYWKSSRFLRDVIEPGMVQPQTKEVSEEKDLHSLIVDTLHDGYELTDKAFKLQRSSYQDIILLGVATWFIASGILILLEYSKMDIPIVLASSFLYTAILVIPFILYSVIKLRPMMIEYVSWRDRLWNLWQMELNGQVDPETSIIDTLLELKSKIPKWIESLWPRYDIRGLITWLSMFTLIYIAFMILFSMDWGANIQDVLGWIPFIMAILMVVVASLLLIWWMLNEVAEKENALIELNEHTARLEREMDTFFD
ncbi:MAG: hypothetical protein GKC03_06920 [Methanomassiliicoccales archaeon]|nr:hypothetical protein [Methanomassiliicoccales archaeon]NYT14738.1 hypothetical protein [Methanomassiliicoccales archaeon]